MSQRCVGQAPIAVVCSFADADLRFKQGLEKHLKILLDKQAMTFWSHDLVQPGDEVAAVRQKRLSAASVILLLLSPDFFDSFQCQQEMADALERERSGTAQVFLILVRPCLWEADGRLRGLPILPDLAESVSGWRDSDQAWLSIVRSLYQRLRLDATKFPESLPVIFQVRALPATYVARPTEFNAVKRLLVSKVGAGTAPAITTALRGAGGFGKTTLAQALCHDPDVQATFADGILWVTLGETPPKALGILKDLIASLSGQRANVNTSEQAEVRLRNLLETRSCLIVLDDVWAGTDLAPFLSGGPRCARLITTRDTSVLPTTSQRVLVDAMREAEAVQLLCQGLPESIHQPRYAAALSALVRDLGEWPLLLTLANGALKERLESRQDLAAALADLRSDYEAEGVVAFDQANTSQRNAAIERSLAVSLKLLDGEESLRYQELTIFPKDIEIPLATVEKLWQATGGLDQRRVKKLCLRLWGLSLLLSCDLGQETIRLHDVVRNYLQRSAETHVAGFHRALLNAYHLPTWGDLSLEDPYLWKYLFYHLKAAGRSEEVLVSAQDLRYLTRKAFLQGSHTIEADLQEATELVPHDQALTHLRSRIAQIGHLLNRSETLVNVQCLFLSYLCDLEHTHEQYVALEKQIDRVYVKACHSLAASFSSTLYRTLQGHTNLVGGCAISADGCFIVSASADGTLKVWKRETGEIIHTLQGHTGWVTGCAISADGSFIVSTSTDRTLKVWKRETGEIIHTLQGHTGWVTGCAISADGGFIVSASDDGTLKIWKRETSEIVHTLQKHASGVTGCAISADGSFIVWGSDDGTLKIWKRETGEIIHTRQGHASGVTGCAISADGCFIVSASFDGTLKIRKRETGEIIHTLRGHTGWVYGCAISADGCFIVSASFDGTLKVWKRETGEIIHTLRGHTGWVYRCAISADGSFIVSASDDGTLKVWKRETGEIIHTPRGHTGWVNGCAISADGCFIVSTSDDGTLKIWKRETSEIVHTLGHGGVTGCAISADGCSIVSASADGTLKVWKRETGKIIHTLQGHTRWVYGCAISADGCFIVSASADGTLKVWKRETGEIIHTLRGHTGWVYGCAISADGSFIVSASDDGTLKVWKRGTGEIIHTLEGHTSVVNGCAISADGCFIVSASADGTLKVWKRETGEIIHTLRGHTSMVNGCAISADGCFIVSASSDTTLKVWEMQSGICLCTLALETPLLEVCFSSESPYFVVSGEAGVYFLQLGQRSTSTHLTRL